MANSKQEPSRRCMWCGSRHSKVHRLDHRKEYEGILVPTHSPIWVCVEHGELIDIYLLELARRSGAWLFGLVTVIALTIAGGASGMHEIAAIGLLVCGVWALLYPYASPETVRRFGVVNSKFLVRWLGGLILAAGGSWLGYMVAVR